MKYSLAITAVLAPLAMAKAIQNSYPLRRDHGSKLSNNGELVAGAVDVVPEVIIIWSNAGGNAATQTVTQTVAVTQTVTAGAEGTTVGSATIAAGSTTVVTGAQATHSVTVGGTSGLVYTPPSIEAAVGDMIIFTFMSTNHTVTQSGFTTPCIAMANGMDSGFQPNANNAVVPPPQVAMQVTVATPLWFYCRQKGHCGKGMVFSVNPTAAKTQDLFQQMAIAQNGTGTGSAITGNSTASGTTTTASSAPSVASATSAASGSVQTGTGTTDSSGACVCAVTCATGSFPVAAAQGLSNFGGFSGSIASSQLEVIGVTG
ncbi:Cupredoxin [Xylariaceae sp. FL0255]|nr:Cupredoxin [Xylariaceae sp. FL0255]